MKNIIVLLFIILPTLNNGQNLNFGYGNYCSINKDSIVYTKISLKENARFEFFIDNLYDCTPMYLVYGKGEYEIIGDSILINFDSIPSIKSENAIDSIQNNNENVDIRITVVNQDKIPLENVIIAWGKPKKKRKWITAQFFDKLFDQSTEISFNNNETINFLRIEKNGYYRSDINIPKNPIKDYNIEVILRKKPQIKSESYISNTRGKLALTYDNRIELNEETKLKKENCH